MKTYRDLYRASVHPNKKMIATLDVLEELNPSCLGDDFPPETYDDPSQALCMWLNESAELGLLTLEEARLFDCQLWRYARNRAGAL